MSNPRTGKSIWKRYDKPQGRAKLEEAVFPHQQKGGTPGDQLPGVGKVLEECDAARLGCH